jgi:hypothetical protein
VDFIHTPNARPKEYVTETLESVSALKVTQVKVAAVNNALMTAVDMAVA